MENTINKIKKSMDSRCRKLSKLVFDQLDIDVLQIVFEKRVDEKIYIKIKSSGIRDDRDNPFYKQEIIIKPKIERKMNPRSKANLKQYQKKKQQELVANTVDTDTILDAASVKNIVPVQEPAADNISQSNTSNKKKKNNKKNKKKKNNKKIKQQDSILPLFNPELELVVSEKERVEDELKKVEEEKRSLEVEIKRLTDEKNNVGEKDEICERCLGDIEAEKKYKIKNYMTSKAYKDDMLNKGHKKVLRSFYGIHKKFEDLVNESLANETKSSYDYNKELNEQIFYIMNNKINFVRKKLDYRSKVIAEYASIYKKYLSIYSKKEGEIFLFRALQEIGFFTTDENEISKLIEEMRRCFEYVHVFESLNKEVPKSDISPILLFRMGSEFGTFISKIKEEIIKFDDINVVGLKEIETI